MCGIVGFIGFSQSFIEQSLRMIAHRGPDDSGMLIDGDVSLGMVRLSIIDVGGGRQPIFNEDGTIGVVFNGEIYNFAELRRQLQERGHVLRASGDTETIVHLYEEYGAACVHLLRGMFAFAIWDTRRRTIFVARDRLGIKPLYYYRDGSRLAFASEIKALRLCPDIGRSLDPVALDHFLACRYVPGPRTMYAGVQKLQPGHTLTLQDDELRLQQYWAPVVKSAYMAISAADASSEVYRLLDEAVRLHMVADVPLGALLSGGIDSAAIVGLMSQYSARPVQTFTVAFDVDDLDESAAARSTAAHFGTDHHELHVGVDVVDLLPSLMWSFDEPVADPAALPTYLISRFARQSVTVAMSGEGADELLGGYPRYYWAAQAQRAQRLLPASFSRLAAQVLTSLVDDPQRRRRISLMLRSMSPLTRYLAWSNGMTARRRSRVRIDTTGVPLPQLRYLAGGATVTDQMRADIATWLVDDVLMKADKMSMAASLELRVPFLDHTVVEFVTALPESLKQPVPTTKPLLRYAMKSLLPTPMRARPKQAFAVPIGEWLRTQLRDVVYQRVLEPGQAWEHGLLNRTAVRRLYNAHVAGAENNATMLWMLLCFETWYQEVFLQPHRTFAASVV